ncbi:DNA cytosine methyltransferase [Coleofasciculus sp. FACHB-SPT9]|uniref:DNA cytosine methyltransferase n=1 Tax=Cyanophyceae TaxID=3028117 RepID=UPI001685D410|nr:DNA cytosine methyltransferase [Coleofasciculus sp. FACHB-SPT9]MBD1892931.1 DNA cytosine methyltransferase [Coleofasciculus sp. FACHB-SPT9]
MFIRTKIIKGQPYRYLVETYKTAAGQKRQKVLKYLGHAPTLPNDAPTAVVLFAGGGGVEAGMVMAGVRPVLSVECDPSRTELSAALAASLSLNFKPYGTKVVQQTVQELADGSFPGFPQPDYLHASPVCSNFSKALGKGTEQPVDLEAATAVATAIRVLQPKCFTLENVSGYRQSKSWQIIQDELVALGYEITAAVLDAADYGVPQSRKRLIVKAARGKAPGLPPKQGRVGWYEFVKDLIPSLPSSQLLPNQQKVLEEKLAICPEVPALLIERIGFRNALPKLREPTEPIWTIKRAIFTDQRQNVRSRFIDLWCSNGMVKRLTVEAAARLQGFPNWYYLPESIDVAGSLLGYSVPPHFAQQLYSP